MEKATFVSLPQTAHLLHVNPIDTYSSQAATFAASHDVRAGIAHSPKSVEHLEQVLCPTPAAAQVGAVIVGQDKKIKATGKEVYNIYSCTKLMTCIAALMLWEQGKFDLEDELYKRSLFDIKRDYIDFNDDGELTGNYTVYSENDDSTIPERLAFEISKEIVYRLNT